MRLALALLIAAPLVAQTSWDRSDYLGVQQVSQPHILPYTAGAFTAGTKRLMRNGAEVPFTQLSDGNLFVVEPTRAASIIGRFYSMDNQGLNRSGTGTSSCFTATQTVNSSTTLGNFQVNDIVTPSGSGASTDVTAGNHYFIVAVDSDACTFNGGNGSFDVSASRGGSEINVTDIGSATAYSWGWYLTCCTWDGADGIYASSQSSTWVTGTAIRLRKRIPTATLPGGTAEATTYWVDSLGGGQFNLYSDAARTVQVLVTSAGSGPVDAIVQAQYALEDTSAAASITNPVVRTQVGDYWQVTNGLAGFRLPATDASCNRGAIQGLVTRSATLVGSRDPNTLYQAAGTTYQQTSTASGIETCVLTWPEDPGEDVGGNILRAQLVYTDSGIGSYTVIVTMYANLPVIEIEYDVDTLNLSENLMVGAALDKVRFHNAGGGKPYGDLESTLTTAMDYRLTGWGMTDTSTSTPRPVKFACLYDDDGAADSDAPCILSGWNERNINIGASAVSNITFETAHPATGEAGAFISWGINKANSVTRRRQKFAIYMAIRSELNIGTTTAVPTPALYSYGVGWAPSLSDLSIDPAYQPAIEPAGGWPYPFSSEAEGDDLTSDMREGSATKYNTLVGQLTNIDAWGMPIIGGLRQNSVLGVGHEAWRWQHDFWAAMQDLYLGYGNWYNTDTWYEFGYPFLRSVAGVGFAIRDSAAYAPLKADIERQLGFICGWSADPNLIADIGTRTNETPTGGGYGLPGQIEQTIIERGILNAYCGERSGSQTSTYWTAALNTLSDVYLNSAHYTGETADPIRAAVLMYKAFGGTLTGGQQSDLTGQSNQIKALTLPPDKRFSTNGLRLLHPGGDSYHQRPESHGQQARADQDAGMKKCWTDFGSQASTFFVPALLMFDWSGAITGSNCILGSHALANYGAFLRTHESTANESLTSLLFGPAQDHQFVSQDGSVQIWAHNAPVSTVWYDQGSPFVRNRSVVNNLVDDSSFTWTNAVSSVSSALTSRWGTSPAEVATTISPPTYLSQVTQVSASGTTWTRTVRHVQRRANYTIVVINDDFSGTGSSDYRVISWNSHAAGDFSGPQGTHTPTVSDYTVSSSNLPNASAAQSMTADTPQEFLYTGAGWVNHNSSGVADWQIFVTAGGASPQYNWGQWCGPMQENSTTFATLYGANPKICQHILRLRGNGGFETVWVIRPKGAAAADSLALDAGTRTLTIGPDIYTWTTATSEVQANLAASQITTGSRTVTGSVQ